MPKKEEISQQSFFQDLALSIKAESNRTDHDIMTFLEEEVDTESWGIELCREQLLPLKVFYGVDLDLKDREILEDWKLNDKTTWDPTDSVKSYQGLIIEAGRRAGKSEICALVLVFEFFKLVTKKNPQRYYGISANSPISLIAVATTADQTQKTIFNKVRGLIQFVRPLQRMVERGDIEVNKKQVSCEQKMVFIYPGHSESSGQVGQNIICLVMDEVARFPTDTEGNSYAETIWTNLGIAGLTFGRDAKRVAVSSAWEPGDAIEKLYENVAKSEEEYIGFRLKSWDINPKFASRENPVVKSEYSLKPLKAALEFEGKRLAPQNRFLNATSVIQSFKGRSKIRYKDEDCSDNLIRKTITYVEPTDHYSVAHVDPAVVTCSYGFAFGHAELNEEGQKIVYIDGMMAWHPEGNTEVSITNVQQAILEINKHRPLYKLTSDHHQNVETIQRMKTYGIRAEGIPFSNKHQLEIYEQLRFLLNEGRVVLPKDSPIKERVKDELTQLELVHGTKITAPKHSSKDVADAIASVAWYLTGNENADGIPKVISTAKPKKENLDPRSLDRNIYEDSFLQRGQARLQWMQEQKERNRFGKNAY